MRPLTVTLTEPGEKIIPWDYRNGDTNVQVGATTATSYSVEFTLTNLYDTSLTPIWTFVTNMEAATTPQDQAIRSPITGIKLTQAGAGQTTFNLVQTDDNI